MHSMATALTYLEGRGMADLSCGDRVRSAALLSTTRSGHQAAAARLRHSIQSIRDRTVIITLAWMHLYFGVDRDKEDLLNYVAAGTLLDKSNVGTEFGDSARQTERH